MSLNEMGQKIKGRQDEIWIILVVLLGAGAIFGGFVWWKQSQAIEPLQIKNRDVLSEVGERATTSQLAAMVTAPISPAAFKKFVASKNGTRYYLPTCSGVKRIKEENKIWFATVEEAESRGLQPAANCPGL